MTFLWFFLILCTVALVQACDRGPRTPGVSWFAVLPEMRGTSKKARGRMQQRKQSHRR